MSGQSLVKDIIIVRTLLKKKASRKKNTHGLWSVLTISRLPKEPEYISSSLNTMDVSCITPPQARNLLLAEPLSKTVLGDIGRRISSDKAFLINLHKLVLQCKTFEENLLPNLSVLFQTSLELFRRFAASLERGSFKVYYQPFLQKFEQQIYGELDLCKVVQMFVKHDDHTRLEKILTGDLEEHEKEALQKTCMVCIKHATKEVKLHVLDVLLAFLDLSSELRFRVVLPHLEDTHGRHPFVEKSSMVLSHLLLKKEEGTTFGIHEIRLIRHCRALYMAVNYFVENQPEREETIKLEVVKHILEFGCYEELHEDHPTPSFVNLLDPISLSDASYYDLIFNASSWLWLEMRLECFLTHRAKRGSLPFSWEFVQKVMSSVNQIDKKRPRFLSFLIKYFIDMDADFGDAHIHQPLSTWNFFLLCVYQKGPHLPFNFRILFQDTTIPFLDKLISSIIVAEGWTQKEWHRIVSLGVLQHRTNALRNICNFLFRAKTDQTISREKCFLLARELEEDLFYRATSLDDFRAINKERIVEANRRVFFGKKVELLGTSLDESLNIRHPFGFCSTTKQPDTITKRIEATIPQICCLLLLVQLHVSMKRENGLKKVVFDGILTKDLILYITEFLPMSKPKFFKLFVYPFLCLRTPNDIILDLYNRLRKIREERDTPFHIQTPVSFCNQVRMIARNLLGNEQSADTINERALILFYVCNYLSPTSSIEMMKEMENMIEKGQFVGPVSTHLLTGVLRHAGNSLSLPWPLTVRQIQGARVTRVYGFMHEHKKYWNSFRVWYKDFCTVLGVK